MPTGDNDNEQIISDRTRERANGALTSLARAAGGAASALFSTRSDVVQLTSGMGALGEAVKFVSAQFDFMRGMSTFGVDFAFQIDEMREAAAGARMSLEQLANVVSNNSQALTMFGGTANEGMTNFLQASRQFFFVTRVLGPNGDLVTSTTEYATRLQRLGFTTDEINDTLVTYNTLNSVAFRREQLTREQRNEAAYNFAKSMDALARMTGKQRQQIQDEMTDRMRQGQSVAFERRLNASSQTSFRTSMALVSQLPESVGNLLQDMIISSVPKTSETRELYAPFQEAAAIAADYGRALRAGASPAELNRLQQAYMAAAMDTINNNPMLADMAELQGIGGVADTYASALGEGAYGISTTVENLRRDLERELGRPVSSAEALATLIERVNREQDVRERDLPNQTTNTRALNNALIALNDTIGIANLRLQQGLIRDFLGGLSRSAPRFEGMLRDQVNRNLAAGERLATSTLDAWTLALTGRGGEALQIATSGISRALATGDQDAVRRLETLTTNLLTAQQSGNNSQVAAIESEINQIVGTLGRTPLSPELVQIQADRVDINGQPLTPFGRPPTEGTPAGNNDAIGTLGTLGRYFKDYREGTQVMLHNMQAVMTPSQAAEFGANIAQGSGERVASLIGNEIGSQRNSYVTGMNTASQFYTRNLNGMLNTITTAMTTNAGTGNDIDLTNLETRISELRTSFEGPMQSLERELATPLNVIAKNSSLQLDVQRDHLKRAKNMTGDGNILRGRVA